MGGNMVDSRDRREYQGEVLVAVREARRRDGSRCEEVLEMRVLRGGEPYGIQPTESVFITALDFAQAVNNGR
jgi:hypothetical protein